MHFLDTFIKIYEALYLFLYRIVDDYGIGLVILSLFTFLFLYPFNKKAQQIQRKEHRIQAVLSPQIASIKKNYSGREQYEQLQWLYRRYGYHPFYAIRSALGFVLQIPFLTAAYYMLSGLTEIQGVSWSFIPNLGAPDHLLCGINILPFIMTMVTVAYAFVMPEISHKERIQTIVIGLFFLILLYSAPSALLIFWTCNLIWSMLDSVLSKKLEWIGDYFVENESAFRLILTFALTVGIFVPLEIYIKNSDQLWFDLPDILKFFLLDMAKYFGFLLLIYIGCRGKINKIIYLSLLFGVTLGIFLQSYIIGLDYGTFDGHEIEWDNFTGLGIVNTFFWITCLLIGLISFRRFNFEENKIKKLVKPVSFCLVLIQCIVLLITAVKNPIQKKIIYDDNRARILTTKNIYKVSAKDNIIVFLIDAFDNEIFEEIRQKNPQAIDEFKDFTYYPDTISSFGFTIYSLPEILTGRLFDPTLKKYPDYLTEAWRDNPNYEALNNHNYSVSLYTSGDYVDKVTPADNLVTEKVVVDKNVADKFSSLVKFRIVPHYLKKLFYQYDFNMQGSVVVNNVRPYQLDDRSFYIDLRNGLKLNTENNCFRFYHLQGVHYPWILDENVEIVKDGEKGTAYKAALGSLKIVVEYITQMKRLRIYDNATIAILADHGYSNTFGRCPIFLVKQPFENNESLRINTRATKVTELMSFVLLRFNNQDKLKNDKENITFNEKRNFYFEDKYGVFYKYAVVGNANNKTSWRLVGKIEQYRDGDRKYHIGETIDFSFYGNSSRYKGSGWVTSPSERYSTSKDEAELIFDIQDKFNSEEEYIVKATVHPTLFLWPFSYKNVTLFANNIAVGNWQFDKDESQEISCKISGKVLKNRPLVLRFLVDVPQSIKEDERFNGRGDVKLVFSSLKISKNNQ